MKRTLILLIVILILNQGYAAHSGSAIDASIDKDLKAVWASMIDRLSAGDIEGALVFVTYGSRWKYRDAFTSAQDKLPEIASEMRSIEPVYIKDNEAKYRTSIGGPDDEYTHYVWFRKDLFGIWKIDKF